MAAKPRSTFPRLVNARVLCSLPLFLTLAPRPVPLGDHRETQTNPIAKETSKRGGHASKLLVLNSGCCM